jgi:hypothetical protein
MGNFFLIQNFMDNVIDIQGASNKPGALLDARPAKSTDNESQLWEFVPDPAGSGYFFIKNKNGNVIDIQKASFKSGAPLDAFPQKAAGTVQRNDNQLWLFMEDPWGSGFYFIVSKLNGNVIDIQGAAISKSGALLDAFPIKAADTQNQLWTASEGVWGPLGAFPKTVRAVPTPSKGLGSNSNYKLFNNCNPLGDMMVIIDVAEDIGCSLVTGGDGTLGFSFQLNCYSPKDHELAYQQFVVALIGNELQYNVQGGLKGGAPLFNVGNSR